MSQDLTQTERERLEKLSAKLKNISNCEMASKAGQLVMLDVSFHLRQAAAQVRFALEQEEESHVAVTII